MVTRDPVQEAFEQIASCENNPSSRESLEILLRILKGKSSFAVARAAKMAGKNALQELVPEMESAFFRLLEKPLKSDKGCEAKKAIVEALDLLECDNIRLFETGIKYSQIEPEYGGPVDKAASLRGRSAAALVRLKHENIFLELANLLFDPWKEARSGAIQAAVYANSSESELLLRMKVLGGDEDPDIVGQCLTGLMSIAPEKSVDFVGGFLASEVSVVFQDAALALAESHSPEAFEYLLKSWEIECNQDRKASLMLPLVISREERGFEIVLDALLNGGLLQAQAAAKALQLCASEKKRNSIIQEALEKRGDEKLADIFFSQ